MNMLAAYYSRACDSRELFDDLSISRDENYLKRLNQYDVIYVNMQKLQNISNGIEEMLCLLEYFVMKELEDCYPEIKYDKDFGLSYCLSTVYHETDRQFVFLIDDWDCVMRECREKEEYKRYLYFLTGLLKDQDYVALAYMTGILPIKKTADALSLDMFDEYPMCGYGRKQPFTGFTQMETEALCRNFGLNASEMKAWYGGYDFDGTELYCPKSVVCSIAERKYKNYQTGLKPLESLKSYISLDFDGLRNSFEKRNSFENMLAGQEVKVETRTFLNDMANLKNKDDVLTLLIYLGFLGYHQERKTVYIPNKEIYEMFAACMRIIY